MAVASSSWGTVKEMSVLPASDVFCTIRSTLMASSARERKIWAAMPGRSSTPPMVTLASEASCTTAETMACSMSSSSLVTIVPCSHVNAERTWRFTPWVRANSTDRMAGLGQPLAVISSSSSKLMRSSLRASSTTRGSVVNTPETSV